MTNTSKKKKIEVENLLITTTLAIMDARLDSSMETQSPGEGLLGRIFTVSSYPPKASGYLHTLTMEKSGVLYPDQPIIKPNITTGTHIWVTFLPKKA